MSFDKKEKQLLDQIAGSRVGGDLLEEKIDAAATSGGSASASSFGAPESVETTGSYTPETSTYSPLTYASSAPTLVSAAAGATNKDKLIAAVGAAGVGDVVWIDIDGFDETFDSGDLTITTNSFHLIGYSKDASRTIIRLGGGGNGILVTASGSDADNRTKIADLTLIGDGATASRGIDSIYTSFVTYENIKATNFATYGINLQNNGNQDIIIKDCELYGNGVGLKSSTGQNSGLQVINCYAHDNASLTGGTTGSGFHLITELTDFVMRDCWSIDNQESGFQSQSFINAIVDNCLFKGNGYDLDAYNPDGWKISQGATSVVNGLTVTNCIFKENGTTALYDDGDGNDRGLGILFKCKGVTKDVLIENCTFQDNGHIGLNWHGRDGNAAVIDNLVVTACSFSGHAFAGVAVDDLGSVGGNTLTATGNYWGVDSGASDLGSGSGDAASAPSQFGLTRVSNEGETLQVTSTVDVE